MSLDNPATTVREQLEQRERDTLSPYAALAAESRGRARTEEEDSYRTCYQRDRDRILHSAAFRRLKLKTQVFLAPSDGEVRTRLTHTLEVAQIARTVARALYLNEDLVEAIALGHDLGHTPFGHAGEAVLNELHESGFNHSDQSVRVVDVLEHTRHGAGLNLTHEVRNGIANHSKGKSILYGRPSEATETLEADVMSVCDAIAYVNHDIDDAIRAGVITMDDLPVDAIARLGESPSERIDAMVSALIRASGEGAIAMEEEVRRATVALREFMFKRVYPCDVIDTEIQKARRIIRELYRHFIENPTDAIAEGNPGDSIERRTIDYIACMTDQDALQAYSNIFFPAAWPR